MGTATRKQTKVNLVYEVRMPAKMRKRPYLSVFRESVLMFLLVILLFCPLDWVLRVFKTFFVMLTKAWGCKIWYSGRSIS